MTLFQILVVLILATIPVMMIMSYRKGTPIRIEGASKWFDKSHPLWLPPGTVRSLIVMGLTYAIIVILLKSIIMDVDLPERVAQYVRELTPAIVLIIQRYIDQRVADTQTTEKKG